MYKGERMVSQVGDRRIFESIKLKEDASRIISVVLNEGFK